MEKKTSMQITKTNMPSHFKFAGIMCTDILLAKVNLMAKPKAKVQGNTFLLWR
jgi:hypothetical protein